MKKNYSITDSEWIIMRLILNKYPITSKEIMIILKDQSTWSPATIKTLLSRLVNKNVIGYQEDKKTFYYFPRVTEMVYVKEEMKSFFSRIYGDTMHYETEHFQFSGYNDQAYIVLLADALEKFYLKLAKDLEFELQEKQIVYLYPSQKALHSALGYENGPSWLTAGWFWGIVHLAPKETDNRPRPEDAALHVFTQLMIHNINERAPFWLIQGISVYESGWLEYEKIKKALISIKDDINPFSIYRIPLDDNLFKNNHGYELTYALIEFIVDQFGYQALLQFLKAPDQQRFIFDCNEDVFWEDWVKFVNMRYLDEQ